MKYDIAKTFKIDYQKSKCPNIYSNDNIRISVIKSNIIRMEYSSTYQFIDEPTQIILQRDLGKYNFETNIENNVLELKTSDVTLSYNFQGFSADNLQIKVNEYASQDSTWKYGKKDERNMLGTARTLDDIDGGCKLETGLVSSAGYSSLNDSESLILKADGFVEVKNTSDDYIDVYYFYHDKNVNELLNDWYMMSGYPPKIDRQYLGNWWSRYWEYNDESLQNVITNFKTRNIPIAVNIMDMDWHTVPSMKYGYGWTGFTWNEELFPNPKKTLEWQHNQGVLVALNLHPADGFRKHEKNYGEIKKILNTKKDVIGFDVTNEQFMEAYFETFIKQNQNIGVDFWWMDWQQGDSSSIKNLDPLFMVNHLHYLDAVKTQKKPLIFSRFSGLGAQRYPIGFSGDTHMTWASLAFQPYFTANSANVGYNYWSHDIGGHFHGKMDEELYVRWLQFGVFSPIMRLHSSKNIMIFKEPWLFEHKIFEISKNFLTLRHQLITYINTFNNQTLIDGTQLIRPLYHEQFDNYRAYKYRNSYYFGKDMIVNPIVEPVNKKINGNLQTTYLPAGVWYDYAGHRYNGDQEYKTFHRLESTCLFFKEGTIIVKDADPLTSHLAPSVNYNIDLFIGNNELSILEENEVQNSYTVYKSEFDGEIQQLHIDSEQYLAISKTKRIIDVNIRTSNKIGKLFVNGYEVPVLTNIELSGNDTISIEILKEKNREDIVGYIQQMDMLSHVKNDIYHNLQSSDVIQNIEYINTLDIDIAQKELLTTLVMRKK